MTIRHARGRAITGLALTCLLSMLLCFVWPSRPAAAESATGPAPAAAPTTSAPTNPGLSGLLGAVGTSLLGPHGLLGSDGPLGPNGLLGPSGLLGARAASSAPVTPRATGHPAGGGRSTTRAPGAAVAATTRPIHSRGTGDSGRASAPIGANSTRSGTGAVIAQGRRVPATHPAAASSKRRATSGSGDGDIPFSLGLGWLPAHASLALILVIVLCSAGVALVVHAGSHRGRHTRR